MRSLVLFALLGCCVAVVYGKTWVTIEKEPIVKDGKSGKEHGGALTGVAVRAKNKNANVNDINIGGGDDKKKHKDRSDRSVDRSDDKKHGNSDSEDIRINWSGDRSDRRRDRSDRSDRSDVSRRRSDESDRSGKKNHKNKWWWKWGKRSGERRSGERRSSERRSGSNERRRHHGGWNGRWNNGWNGGWNNGGFPTDTNGDGLPDFPTDTNGDGLPDFGVPTSTSTASTTTVSPNCTCSFLRPTSPGGATTAADECQFPAEDVQAHCDQWGYSLCRAVCTAAQTINQQKCTPQDATNGNVKNIYCTCPILKFPGRSFTVPDTPATLASFYDSRYKTCWKQCKSQWDRSYSNESRRGSRRRGSGRRGSGRRGSGRRGSRGWDNSGRRGSRGWDNSGRRGSRGFDNSRRGSFDGSGRRGSRGSRGSGSWSDRSTGAAPRA